MACKPDSVQGFRLWMTIPLPHLLPDAIKLPTRASGLKRPCGGLCCRRRLALLAVADLSTQGPYSALLRVGLAMPVLLPVPRWAFTPPFHLFLACKEVCSLWRFPWGCPRRGLPGTLASWSPDFPRTFPPAVIQPSARGGAYACAGGASTPKRAARSAAIAASTGATGPDAPGRNRQRNARSRASSSQSG